ncbi:alpha/beta hydrolase, partial [Lacticaseibacillus rhamnosus]
LTADAGPLYLANSQAEIIPVSGIYRLAQAAAKVGVPVTLQVIPGGQHAEGYLSAAWPGTVAFLAQHLVKGSI